MGNVIATDMSKLAPALYEADKHYIVPCMNDEGYLGTILDLCKKENIDGVLSLIDPELVFLSKYENQFRNLGVTVVGSSYELCEMSLDKYLMYKWLKKHGYKCAKSYMNLEKFYNDINAGEISYPVFVKPSRGSGSTAVSRADNRRSVDLLLCHHNGFMVQEYMDGQEIGADVYIDMISRKVVSIFTKKKIKMKAGETDKAVSFKDDRLFDFIEKFVDDAGYTGQIDIDLFQKEEDYYISEVNPRFGGGYPHAYECGVNHMELIINNLNGIRNDVQIGRYPEGVYMMKYSDIYTLPNICQSENI